MKKKLFIIIPVVLIIIAIAGYKMLYKEHRDISSEEAEFTLTATALLNEFTSNESQANAKYADKTIVVSGKVTAVDAASGTVTIDEILSATLKDKTQQPAGQSTVTVKGRFVGYDDLLGELKMDQVTITK